MIDASEVALLVATVSSGPDEVSSNIDTEIEGVGGGAEEDGSNSYFWIVDSDLSRFEMFSILG